MYIFVQHSCTFEKLSFSTGLNGTYTYTVPSIIVNTYLIGFSTKVEYDFGYFKI